MQRSSESIGQLGDGTRQGSSRACQSGEVAGWRQFESDGPSGAGKSFRYAPLSSGLEIVRKTLGQHEIATRADHGDRSDRRGQSISQRCWRMLPANGSPRTGRSVPSAKPRPRIGWVRH